MKAIKIFSLMVVWFALLFAMFSFCNFSFDAEQWGIGDRIFMIFIWSGMSFASTGYILENKK